MFESSRLLEEWLAGERFAYWAIFFLYFYSNDILSSQEQTLEDFKGKVTLKQLPMFRTQIVYSWCYIQISAQIRTYLSRNY